MGIGVTQWRIEIGKYWKYVGRRRHSQGNPQGVKTASSRSCSPLLALMLSFCIITAPSLLLLAGDVERNPGPPNTEERVIRTNIAKIADQISSGNLVHCFAANLTGKGFIASTQQFTVSSDAPFSQVSQMLGAVQARLKMTDTPEETLKTFIGILQDMPVLEELTKQLIAEYESHGGTAFQSSSSASGSSSGAGSSSSTGAGMLLESYGGAAFQSSSSGSSSGAGNSSSTGAGTLPGKLKFNSGNTAIGTYVSYLKHDVYLRQKFPIYEKWPANPAKKIINLALIKKHRMSKEESREFTNQTTRGNIDIIHEKESISMEEIGKIKDTTIPKCILVEGAPGVGKSTFAWQLCRMWSEGKHLQQYRVVVLLRLRDNSVREAKTVSDLFCYYNPEIQQTVVKKIQATGGRGVLLLFEGYDELPAKLRAKNSIFINVIKGKQLPLATVLITTRPSTSSPLYTYECTDYIDQHIEILGFTQDNIQSYIKSTIGYDDMLHRDFKQYLKDYPHINTMLHIPLNCAIIVEVYRANKKSKEHISKTLTDLYSSLLRSLLRRYLEDKGKSWDTNDFHDLPSGIHQQLCELGRIAYEGILHDQQVIFSDLPSNFDALDLMQCVPELYVDEVTTKSFNFLHLTLQEYMAALHLSEQPIEEQIEVFQTYLQPIPTKSTVGKHQESKSHFQIMLRFLAGLSKFEDYSTYSIRSLLTNPNHISSPASHDTSSNLWISLDGLHWIFEGENTSKICEAIGTSIAAVQLSGPITSFDCFVLGYCVSHCKCPWEIDLGGCGIGDEGVEMLYRGTVEGKANHSGYISVVNVRCNKITSAGLKKLLQISQLLRLRELNMSSNFLSKGGAVSLLESRLVDNLEELRLAGTGMGVDDCHALSKLLSSSHTLKVVSISNNDLISPEAVEHIITALKDHTVALKELDIGGLHLNHQNCISLASVSKPPTELNLVYCHIDDVGAIELAKLIDQNTTTKLWLEGNPISIKGATAFAEKLHIPKNTSLIQLDLRQESIGLEGTQKLIDSLSQNSTLKKLWLPLQYKSSVDTSACEVKDRIEWRGKPSRVGKGVHANTSPPAPLSSDLELDSGFNPELDSSYGISLDTEPSPSKRPRLGPLT